MLIHAASVITVSTILYTVSAMATSTIPSAAVSTIPATTLIPYECMSITRALRAHTPRAPCICIYIVQLGHMLSTTFTYMYEASASAHEQKYMHNA